MKSFFKSLIKEDPIESSLTRLLLFTQNTSTLNLLPLLNYYHKSSAENKGEEVIDYLTVQIEKQKPMIVKLKILIFLFSISKISTFDIAQLITRKKLKLFQEDPKKYTPLTLFDLSHSTKPQYIHKYIILGIYNYMIKLSTNQELYNTCKSGEIPEDQMFRKGSRVRCIWVFKVFNLINLLLPLLSPALILIDKYPLENIFIQVLTIIKKDIAIYFSFISKCIEETSNTNPFLLPYNDCLQYYECVKEYRMFKMKNERLMKEVSVHVPEPEIKFPGFDEGMYAELEILAMRIQLINSSLKGNSSKSGDNEKLVTEYNEKVKRQNTILNTVEN